MCHFVSTAKEDQVEVKKKASGCDGSSTADYAMLDDKKSRRPSCVLEKGLLSRRSDRKTRLVVLLQPNVEAVCQLRVKEARLVSCVPSGQLQ